MIAAFVEVHGANGIEAAYATNGRHGSSKSYEQTSESTTGGTRR